MRWDGLFNDLSAQAEALDVAERSAEIEDRTRSELGRITFVDRCHASLGHEVRLNCAGGYQVQGVLRRANGQWLLLQLGNGLEALVVVDQVVTVSGLGRLAEPEHVRGRVERRLGLAHALRRIARDRSSVHLHLEHGGLDGTIDRVGRDFLELAVHPAGEARRTRAVRSIVLVPLAALVAAVRSRDAVE